MRPELSQQKRRAKRLISSMEVRYHFAKTTDAKQEGKWRSLRTEFLKLLPRYLPHLKVVPRQSSHLAGICEHSDGALSDGYCFRSGVSFAAGFEKVVEPPGRLVPCRIY